MINRQQDDVTKTFLDYLKTRRQKYNYCNKENGKFEGGFAFFISSSASVLAVPLLVFIALNIMDIYLNFGIEFRLLLWPLLTAVSFLIFWAPLAGYLLDRLEKAGYGAMKGMLVIFGTLGLIACCVFLFRAEPEVYQDLYQLQAIFVAMAFLFPLAATQSVKNSTYYTPSQDDRRKLIFMEYVIAFSILIVFIAIPYLINAIANPCNCAEICMKAPEADACKACYQQCDNFAGKDYFSIVLIVLVGLFGFINIINYVSITLREPEEEYAAASLNSRFNDLGHNSFLILTIFISILEYFMFFAFAFWVSYYVYYQLIPENYCGLEFHYYCTRGFWVEFPFVVFLTITIIIGTAFGKASSVNIWWTWITPAIIAAGIVMICLSSKVELWFFLLIVFLGAAFFSSIPNTKLMLTDGIYYEEYLSGNAQPNFTSSLYIACIVLGFFLTMLTEFSLINPEFTAGDAFKPGTVTNYITLGTGIVFTAAGGVVFIMKFFYFRYELIHFDKIQLAIERNNSNADKDYSDRYSFYDPIQKDIIKKVVRPKTQEEARIFYLMNTLSDSNIDQVKKRKLDRISYAAYIKNIFLFIFLFLCIFFIIWYIELQTQIIVWAFTGNYIFPAFILLAMLYNWNVARAASKLRVYNDDLYSDFLTKYVIWRTRYNKGNEKQQS